MRADGFPVASPPGPEPAPAPPAPAGAAGGARPEPEAETVEPAAISDEAPPGELPPVDELVSQLRPELRATLEELFRAQWSGVRRLRPEDLGPS